MFSEIDLFLRYQNLEFIYFWACIELFLLNTDEIFELYILLVNVFLKFKHLLNKVIIGQNCIDKYLINNTLLDILIR